MSCPVYFCSSVGGGVFGTWQTESWRARGLDTHEVYAVKLGDYWRAKSHPARRLVLRWRMYVSYPISLRRRVRAEPGDALFVTVTNPFFLPALAARAARGRSAKIINLVFDLYPDALIFGGGISRQNPFARLAAATTRAAIRDCAATVYLGERVRSYAESMYGVARKTAVIPVGTDVSPFRSHPPSARKTGIVRFLYSGHMGKLHDWRTLADALPEMLATSPDITIEIAADGPGAVKLRQTLGARDAADHDRLRWSGTRPSAEWTSAMLAADIALVTMVSGAEKVVMPSKTYSAMAAGQAILAVCPRQSDLADLVLHHSCGWVVPPGDARALVAAVREIVSDCDRLLRCRTNAWHAAHNSYSMEANAVQWHELFASLLA